MKMNTAHQLRAGDNGPDRGAPFFPITLSLFVGPISPERAARSKR
jgi:hypothetical protein